MTDEQTATHTLSWRDRTLRIMDAHDDLVAACEEMLSVLTEPGIMDVDEWKAWKKRAEATARAAIAKAKGTPCTTAP